jgi:hypothetical protein
MGCTAPHRVCRHSPPRPCPHRAIAVTRTDQKVGGSNPSGRALQIRCTAAVSAVSGDLGTRSHPINRPIEFGRGPLTHCDSVGVSIVVRTVALTRDARGGGSLRQRRPGVWEVRVAVGQDPVSGRSRYLSFSSACTVTATKRRRPDNSGWCCVPLQLAGIEGASGRELRLWTRSTPGSEKIH